MSAQKPKRGSKAQKKKASTKSKSPLAGWRNLNISKPKMVIKRGEEARQIEREEANRPLTRWGLAVRLLPIWILLLAILFIAPALPCQIVSGAFTWVGETIQWAGSLVPDPPPPTATPSDPVFIVEAAAVSIPPPNELPPPNWDLSISEVFTPGVQYWAEDIAAWSSAYRIKPNLIATIMQIESCGDPEVVSEAGATGLFQVMPFHFEGDENPTNPETNARRAMEILSELLATANGNVLLAFVGYNGGQGMMFTEPLEWPAETQYYQFWGGGIYEEAELGFEQSPTLLDWLSEGGYGLCTQAAESLGIDAAP